MLFSSIQIILAFNPSVPVNSNVAIEKNVVNIPDCYLTTSSADIYPETNQVCINLISNNNPNCHIIPEGVEIIFRWSNMQYYQSQYIFDFSYLNTIRLCTFCKAPNDCKKMIDTKNIQVTIQSVVDSVEISIGLIVSQRANLKQCFQDAKNQVNVDQTGIFVTLYPSRTCDHIFNQTNTNIAISKIQVLIEGERTEDIIKLVLEPNTTVSAAVKASYSTFVTESGTGPQGINFNFPDIAQSDKGLLFLHKYGFKSMITEISVTNTVGASQIISFLVETGLPNFVAKRYQHVFDNICFLEQSWIKVKLIQNPNTTTELAAINRIENDQIQISVCLWLEEVDKRTQQIQTSSVTTFVIQQQGTQIGENIYFMFQCDDLFYGVDDCASMIKLFYDSPTDKLNGYIELIYLKNSGVQEYMVFNIPKGIEHFKKTNIEAVVLNQSYDKLNLTVSFKQVDSPVYFMGLKYIFFLEVTTIFDEFYILNIDFVYDSTPHTYLNLPLQYKTPIQVASATMFRSDMTPDATNYVDQMKNLVALVTMNQVLEKVYFLATSIIIYLVIFIPFVLFEAQNCRKKAGKPATQLMVKEELQTFDL